MKGILILVGLVLGIFVSSINTANAQYNSSDPEWILCANCTSDSQFRAAAVARAPERTGEYFYAVGNTNTGVLKYVDVFKTMPGEIPRSLKDPQSQVLSRELGGMGSVGFLAVEGDVVTVSEDPEELEALVQAVGGSGHVFVSSASPAEQQQFGAIVNVSKNSIIVSAPAGYGFSSFRGAQMEIVSPFLYSAMAAGANPAWQAGEIPSLWKGLFNALKALNGKGPTACIVYQNGDSACYQLNILDKNAARYITDSAKDANGNLIPASGGIGGGGSDAGLNVLLSRPVGGYTSWNRGSSRYLVCGYVGGQLVSCYVE